MAVYACRCKRVGQLRMRNVPSTTVTDEPPIQVVRRVVVVVHEDAAVAAERGALAHRVAKCRAGASARQKAGERRVGAAGDRVFADAFSAADQDTRTSKVAGPSASCGP